MRFENKSVIITGGGGKIGRAYAIGFAKEGAKVALPDIASADHVVKTIRDMGGTAMSMAPTAYLLFRLYASEKVTDPLRPVAVGSRSLPPVDR